MEKDLSQQIEQIQVPYETERSVFRSERSLSAYRTRRKFSMEVYFDLVNGRVR